MKKHFLIKLFIFISVLFVSILNTKANNDFSYDYELNINEEENIVEIDNTNINLNNDIFFYEFHGIEISFPSYLTYKDEGITLPNGWIFGQDDNHIRIDTNFTNEVLDVISFLDSVSFDVNGDIVEDQVIVTLHYIKRHYEFVSEKGIRWYEAYEDASKMEYDGMQGYLATITSEAERIYIEDKVSKQMGCLVEQELLIKMMEKK